MAQAESGSAPFLLPVRTWGMGMGASSHRASSHRGSSHRGSSHHGSSHSGSSPKRKKRPPPRRPNTKQTGERSEAAFLHRASGLGFGVAKPWGDSLRYDFILDNGERLWRI